MLDDLRFGPGNAKLFGHADADGYLAAEVSRQNLVSAGWAVQVVVDPKITANYRFWAKRLHEQDFDGVDLAVFVDIAFDFKDPTQSFEALIDTAKRHSRTQFHVIDHHELPVLGVLPINVTLSPTTSVYECCYGSPNDLMVVASICDKDEGPVSEIITPAHRVLADGVKRAAADTHGAAGTALMRTLESQQWAWLFTLGNEPKAAHRTFYGRRTKSADPSPALQYLSESVL